MPPILGEKITNFALYLDPKTSVFRQNTLSFGQNTARVLFLTQSFTRFSHKKILNIMFFFSLQHLLLGEAHQHGLVAVGKVVKVGVEFSLEDPQGGIHFVVPEGPPNEKPLTSHNQSASLAERGAHLFTCGHENSSRLWFPCVDTLSELCKGVFNRFLFRCQQLKPFFSPPKNKHKLGISPTKRVSPSFQIIPQYLLVSKAYASLS